MSSDNTVTIGEHFSKFVKDKIEEGRYESVSEVIRAGLRLLEKEEARLELLHKSLSNDGQKTNEVAQLELKNRKKSDDGQSRKVVNDNELMDELTDFRQ